MPAAAARATPSLADAVASRAFDRAKPAIVRIEAHASVSYQVTEPDLSGDALHAFVTSDVRRLVANGVLGPTQGVDNLLRDVTSEVKSHPDEFFKPGTMVDSQAESTSVVGTGTLVSADGDVVTSSRVITSTDAILADLRRQATSALQGQLQSEVDGLSSDIADSVAADVAGIPVDIKLVNNYANTIVNTAVLQAMKTLKVSAGPKTSLVVQLGAATPGAHDPPAARPATVLASTATSSRAGVTVLKITGAELPTASVLPAHPLAQGQLLVAAGYDAFSSDGTDLGSTAIRPTRAEGAVKFGEGSRPSMDVTYSPGKVGGPLLTPDGRVAGVILALDEVGGTDAIAAALGKANVPMADNPQMRLWERATDAYAKAYYKRALGPLTTLRAANPQFPYVDELIARARAGIAAHKDKTPHSLPVGWEAAAGVLIAAAAAGVLRQLIVDRRRPSAQPRVQTAIA